VKLLAIKKDKDSFKVESKTVANVQGSLNNSDQTEFVLSLPADPVGPEVVLDRNKDSVVFVSIRYSLPS
jgi:hypothetical protein